MKTIGPLVKVTSVKALRPFNVLIGLRDGIFWKFGHANEARAAVVRNEREDALQIADLPPLE